MSIGFNCYNPAAMAAYNYNAGTQLAMSNIYAAQMSAMPTFGAGDSSYFPMDYPLVGGCFYPSVFYTPITSEMAMYSAGKGLGSFIASPITALRDAFNKHVMS